VSAQIPKMRIRFGGKAKRLTQLLAREASHY